jgi:hypothetical protein
MFTTDIPGERIEHSQQGGKAAGKSRRRALPARNHGQEAFVFFIQSGILNPPGRRRIPFPPFHNTRS